MKRTLPKVAIVRGHALSKWEMQIYEPLTRWFDLVGIGSTVAVNDATGIQFPTVHLPTISPLVSSLPKFVPLMFSLFGDTQWLGGFAKSVRGVDLIHSVEAHNGYTLQAVRAKQKGIVKRVTLTVYENIPYLFHEFPRRNLLKQEVYTHADHFLAANEMSRQTLLLEGVSAHKISLIPQSVDAKIFYPESDPRKKQELKTKIKSYLGIDPQKFLILCVGRMVWEKGWYDIVPAAQKLKQLTKNKIAFLCVGEGPEKTKLENLVADLKLKDAIHFTGLRPYREMAEIFRTADVFLYPSLPTPIWNAQFGGVLIEAMASGLPIVGTWAGGTATYTVGKEGGLFVQPQHFSGLVESIFTLYKKPFLRKKLGTRNRKYVLTHYDVPIVAKRIKHIWDELLR